MSVAEIQASWKNMTIDERLEAIHKGLGITGDDVNDWKGSWAKLKGDLGNSIMPILTDMGKTVLPALTPILQGVADAFRSFSSATGGMGPVILVIGAAITGLILIVAGLYAAVAPLLVTAGPIIAVVAGIAALALGFVALYNNVGWFKDGVDGLIESLTSFYNDSLVPLGQYLYSVFVNAWNQLSSALNVAWNDYLAPFIDWLSSTFGPIFGQAGGSVDYFGIVFNILSMIVQHVIDVIVAYIQMLWTVISNIFGIIGDLIKGDWLSAWNRAGTIVQSVLDFINTLLWGLPGKVWNAAVSAGQSIYNGLQSGIGNLFGMVSAEFWNVVNAIKNIAGQVWQAAVNVGNSIVNGIKSALHINSPGLVHDLISQEMQYSTDAISDASGDAYSAALGYGDAIAAGISDSDMVVNNPTSKLDININANSNISAPNGLTDSTLNNIARNSASVIIDDEFIKVLRNKTKLYDNKGN
jgi:phage-related protein